MNYRKEFEKYCGLCYAKQLKGKSIQDVMLYPHCNKNNFNECTVKFLESTLDGIRELIKIIHVPASSKDDYTHGYRVGRADVKTELLKSIMDKKMKVTVSEKQDFFVIPEKMSEEEGKE